MVSLLFFEVRSKDAKTYQANSLPTAFGRRLRGHLMSFVLWEASTILPAEMIAALGGRDSDPNKPHNVAVRPFQAMATGVAMTSSRRATD
jgi:hypothetical protein